MMYFDQLATTNNRLSEIKYNTRSSRKQPLAQINDSKEESSKYVPKMINAYLTEGTIDAVKGILPKNKRKSRRLTRKWLKSQADWLEWKKSEWEQLDQYTKLDTFGPPCQLPLNTNILNLRWAYTLEDPVNATSDHR